MRAWHGWVLALGIVGCDRATHRPTLEPETTPEVAVFAERAPGAEAPRTPASDAARPVVVELFSSEGCSSCPPADLALGNLASAQGVAGAKVIALELHVDYWDDLGWADPFSSAAFSARQRNYARAASRRGAFTPEAIIDGGTSVVGSDVGALSSAVEQAASRPHLGLTLTTRRDGSIDARSSAAPSVPASYWLAITESGLVTEVKAGENRGQTLRHAPVVRALTRVGPATAEAAHVELPAVRATKGELTAVVFIQQDEDLAILGAETLALTK